MVAVASFWFFKNSFSKTSNPQLEETRQPLQFGRRKKIGDVADPYVSSRKVSSLTCSPLKFTFFVIFYSLLNFEVNAVYIRDLTL